MDCYFKDLDSDEEYLITEGVSFGRSEGTYQFPNNIRMSKVHCKITIMGAYYYIIDLGSRNGTYVNTHRCQPHEKVQLSPNSIVIFGQRSFIFKAPEEVDFRRRSKKNSSEIKRN